MEEVVWDALAMGEECVVRRADMSTFKWAAEHPQFGSVIHAICFGCIASVGPHGECAWAYYCLVTDDDAGAERRLSLLQHAMDQGADPGVVAPASCNRAMDHIGDDEETAEVFFAGRTSLKALLMAKRILWTARAADDSVIERVDRALAIVMKTAKRAGLEPKVCVSGSVFDTWASILDDTTSADIVIRVAPPPPDTSSRRSARTNTETTCDIVKAHSLVLRAASPALRAMFPQGMRQGQREEITLIGGSAASVRIMLSLVYTSSVPMDHGEPSGVTMLEALLLAHRLDIQHVVDMLVPEIVKRMDVSNFEQICKAALRLNVVKLVQACRAFIASHGKEVVAKVCLESWSSRGGRGRSSQGGGDRHRSSGVRVLEEIISVLFGSEEWAATFSRKKPRLML